MIPYTEWEVRAKLEEIQRGDCVVIPQNIEHAEFMLKIAQAYINEHKREMMEILKK